MFTIVNKVFVTELGFQLEIIYSMTNRYHAILRLPNAAKLPVEYPLTALVTRGIAARLGCRRDLMDYNG